MVGEEDPSARPLGDVEAAFKLDALGGTLARRRKAAAMAAGLLLDKDAKEEADAEEEHVWRDLLHLGR